MPLKKIGRAIKKTVRKVVPKEVAGIMTAAAPFVAPTSLPLAAALSIGGQLRMGRGRINPITTALSLIQLLLMNLGIPTAPTTISAVDIISGKFSVLE